MMNDMSMMMKEYDVIGINQCLCLPKAELNAKSSTKRRRTHITPSAETTRRWDTSQLVAVGFFLPALVRHGEVGHQSVGEISL